MARWLGTLLLLSVILSTAAILLACGGTSSQATRSPATLVTNRTTTPGAVPTSAATATTTTLTVGMHCGAERWSVKTLSDQDAANVHFLPEPATVSQLRAIPVPPALPADERIGDTELKVFTVTGRLVEAKLEDDRDIHLVIADLDDPAQTMIVEFPDAQFCSGAVDSAHAAEMLDARAAFISAFGAPPSTRFERLSGTATVTGVGFYDVIHGQTGAAPNGIELHPVLAFREGG